MLLQANSVLPRTFLHFPPDRGIPNLSDHNASKLCSYGQYRAPVIRFSLEFQSPFKHLMLNRQPGPSQTPSLIP
jgi:hypothetical protein